MIKGIKSNKESMEKLNNLQKAQTRAEKTIKGYEPEKASKANVAGSGEAAYRSNNKSRSQTRSASKSRKSRISSRQSFGSKSPTTKGMTNITVVNKNRKTPSNVSNFNEN